MTFNHIYFSFCLRNLWFHPTTLVILPSASMFPNLISRTRCSFTPRRVAQTFCLIRLEKFQIEKTKRLARYSRWDELIPFKLGSRDTRAIQDTPLYLKQMVPLYLETVEIFFTPWTLLVCRNFVRNVQSTSPKWKLANLTKLRGLSYLKTLYLVPRRPTSSITEFQTWWNLAPTWI